MNNIEQFKTEMRQFIEHSPPAKQGPEGLNGFYFKMDGGLAYLCQPCASRIMARGVNLPGGLPSWKDAPSGVCIVCGQ